MNQPITIRQATERDNILLSWLGRETFSDAFGPDNTVEDVELYLKKSFSQEIQAAELADPSTIFLIAEISGEPVGYTRLCEGAPPVKLDAIRPVEIVRFYSRTQWIGRGVGASLMDASLYEARKRHCGVIWLDVWERNERAISFYLKWGFVEFGRQPFQLGNDIQADLLMARPVLLPGSSQ